MVYCWRCGEENPDDAVHCKKCGALLRPKPYRGHYEEELCFGPERRPFWSLVFGILIVLAGLIWLLEPYIPWLTWRNVWPILVILFGIYIILKALGMWR